MFADNQFQRDLGYLQRTAGASAQTTRTINLMHGMSLTPQFSFGETYLNRHDDRRTSPRPRPSWTLTWATISSEGTSGCDPSPGFWDAQYVFNRRLKPDTMQDDAGAPDRGVQQSLLTLQDTFASPARDRHAVQHRLRLRAIRATRSSTSISASSRSSATSAGSGRKVAILRTRLFHAGHDYPRRGRPTGLGRQIGNLRGRRDTPHQRTRRLRRFARSGPGPQQQLLAPFRRIAIQLPLGRRHHAPRCTGFRKGDFLNQGFSRFPHRDPIPGAPPGRKGGDFPHRTAHRPRGDPEDSQARLGERMVPWRKQQSEDSN